jgi:transcriptional regulator with XRE-family HTH domain
VKKLDFTKIGEEIRNLRKSLGMSQMELAKGICTQSQISVIEKGEVYPLASTLYFISQKLGVDINYFYEIASTPKVDYVNEVALQLKQARRDMKYDIIRDIVKAERNNPLFKDIRKNKQLILWHQGICEYEINKNPELAKQLLFEAIELTHATDKVFNEREIEIYSAIAVIHFNANENEKVIEIYDMVLPHLERIPFLQDVTIKTRIFYNKAKALSRLFRFEESNHSCKQAIDWCLKTDNMYLFGESYYHTGYNYEMLENYITALRYMENAKKIFELRLEERHIPYIEERIRSIQEKVESQIRV